MFPTALYPFYKRYFFLKGHLWEVAAHRQTALLPCKDDLQITAPIKWKKTTLRKKVVKVTCITQQNDEDNNSNKNNNNSRGNKTMVTVISNGRPS